MSSIDFSTSGSLRHMVQPKPYSSNTSEAEMTGMRYLSNAEDGARTPRDEEEARAAGDDNQPAPVYPERLYDVRDESPSRVFWMQYAAQNKVRNKYMDRIMSFFGFEGFKKFCLDQFIRIHALPKEERKNLPQLDLALVGNTDNGSNGASTQYHELLQSLGAMPHKSKVARFNFHPALRAEFEGYVDRILANADDGATSNGHIVVLDGVYCEKYGLNWHAAFEQYRKRTELVHNDPNNPLHVLWIGMGPPTTPAHEPEPASYCPIYLPDLTDKELRHFFVYELGLYMKTTVVPEGGSDGPLVTSIVNKIRAANEPRKTWRHVNTLGERAAFLRKRRNLRYWSEFASDEMAAITVETWYYAKCHLLGETPQEFMTRVPGYRDLRNMVGLDDVKTSMTAVVCKAQRDHIRRLTEGQSDLAQPAVTVLNRCFVGPPGTGRLTVARIYAQVLYNLGLVESRAVETLYVADLARRSQTEISEYIDSVLRDRKECGAVIFRDIEEFEEVDPVDKGGYERQKLHWILSRGRGGAGGRGAVDEKDEKSAQPISADQSRMLVYRVLSSATRTEDTIGRRPVLIIVGRSAPVRRLRHRPLPGQPSLKHIFPEEAQVVECRPYTTDDLMHLFKRQVDKHRGSGTSDEAFSNQEAVGVLRELLDVERLRPSFDNLRFVQRLYQESEERKALRYFSASAPEPDSTQRMLLGTADEAFLPTDFAAGAIFFDTQTGTMRHRDKSGTEQTSQFLGLEAVTQELESIYTMATTMRRTRQADPRPHVPYAFVFRGPTGSGKTHVAHNLVSHLYEAMGLLDKAEVMEYSVSDVVQMRPRAARTGTAAGGRAAAAEAEPELDLDLEILEMRQLCKERLAHIMTLAVGKVLFLRNHKTTAYDYHDYDTLEQAASDAGTDVRARQTQMRHALERVVVLDCIHECLLEERFKWKLVVVFEEDESADDSRPLREVSPDPRAGAAELGPWSSVAMALSRDRDRMHHFKTISFPPIESPALVLSMLQLCVGRVGIQIEGAPAAGDDGLNSGLGGNLGGDAASAAGVSRFLRRIVRRPSWAGGWEMEALGNAIAKQVCAGGGAGGGVGPNPVWFSSAELLSLLKTRYPELERGDSLWLEVEMGDGLLRADTEDLGSPNKRRRRRTEF